MIRKTAPLLTLLALAALPASAHIDLERTGGLLGGNLTYNLEGDPGQLFIVLPSTTSGPTPLTLLDPTDPRMLGVGMNLIDYMTIGVLDGAGLGSATYALPASPVLSGIPVFAQMVTAPGLTTVVDEISAVTSFTLGLPGDSHLTMGELPVATAGYGSAPLPDGKLLLGGGSTAGNSLRVFDPQTQTFSNLAAVMSYSAITPAAVALADGRVLFCGGVSNTNAILSNVSIYNPATGTSSAGASMTSPRAQHTVTLLNDGRVFVTGGVRAIDVNDPIASLNDILKTSSIYNPATNSWSSAASMPLPRVGHNASLLPSGKVLITGGLQVDSFFGIPLPGITNDCRRYNPSNNSMENAANMSGNRALHGQLSLSDGRVFVGGGADGDVLTQNFFSLASTRVYSEGANSWSNTPSFPGVRTLPNLVEAGGKVHVLSGLSTIDLSTLSGVPATNILSGGLASFSWQASGTMVTGRPASSAHAIDGGERIIVLGPGTGAGDKSAEIFIP